MENKKRIDELDMAKGLGMVIVFLTHTCEFTGISAHAPASYRSFHVFIEAWMMMFMLLSGYTYRPKETLVKDFQNKVQTWLLPFLYGCTLCSVFYLITDFFIGKMDAEVFLQNTISNYLGSDSTNLFCSSVTHDPLCYALTPYWYISEVFVSFLLVMALARFLWRKGKFVKLLASGLLLFLGMVFNALDLQGTVENTFASVFSYFALLPNFFGIAGVLLLGSFLRDVSFLNLDAQPPKKQALLAIGSLAVWLPFELAYDTSYALQCGKWGPYGMWSVLITPVCGVALTYLLALLFHVAKKVPGIRPVFSYLGQNSLYILLSHCLFCELFCRLFGKWHYVYNTGFPAEDFTKSTALLIILLTALAVLGTLALKNRIRAALYAKKK